MSKLVERLENLSKEIVEPMGFKAAAHKNAGIPMLIIAALPKVDVNLAQKIGKAADAVIFTVNDPDKDLNTLKNLPGKDFTWGVWLKGKDPELHLAGSGADFLIFEPENTPASVLRIEELGKFVEVSPSIADGIGSCMEDLPIDGVVISSTAGILSVKEMMTFRWISDLIGKPLLAFLTSEVTAEDLSSLCEVGVQGVITPVKSASDKDRLSEWRKALSDKPVKRTGKKISPLLPRISSGSSSFDEEDEEE